MSVRIMFAARVRMLVFRPVTMEPIADLFGYELHTQIFRGVSSAPGTLNPVRDRRRKGVC